MGAAAELRLRCTLRRLKPPTCLLEARLVTWKATPHRTGCRFCEFTAGRRCASLALRGLGMRSGSIGRDRRGAPLWPRLITGSLSHAHGLAICIVVRRRLCAALGIDIEPLRRDFPDAAKALCATSAQIAQLDALPEPMRTRYWFIIFSASESLLKMYWTAFARIPPQAEFNKMTQVLIDKMPRQRLTPDPIAVTLPAKIRVVCWALDGFVLSLAWLPKPVWPPCHSTSKSAARQFPQ